MSRTVTIRDQDLAIVQNILRRHVPPGSIVKVFGARARGRARRGSDLDLAIDAGRPLRDGERAALAEAFEESDMPYGVDILDARVARATFLASIENEGAVDLDWEDRLSISRRAVE